MGKFEIEQYLTNLAVNNKVSPTTQIYYPHMSRQTNNETKHKVFCVLATKNQMIISSNDKQHNIGELFNIDKSFLSLKLPNPPKAK